MPIGGYGPNYGIKFIWEVANTREYVEVFRAPDDGTGSPSTSGSMIAILNPSITEFIDSLPNDSTLRHYRLRHVFPGYNDGTWTGYLRAKPAPIPTGDIATPNTTI